MCDFYVISCFSFLLTFKRLIILFFTSFNFILPSEIYLLRPSSIQNRYIFSCFSNMLLYFSFIVYLICEIFPSYYYKTLVVLQELTCILFTKFFFIYIFNIFLLFLNFLRKDCILNSCFNDEDFNWYLILAIFNEVSWVFIFKPLQQAKRHYFS